MLSKLKGRDFIGMRLESSIYLGYESEAQNERLASPEAAATKLGALASGTSSLVYTHYRRKRFSLSRGRGCLGLSGSSLFPD